MTTADPLTLILERPTRRSRSETLLRELVHTSYPHALLGNTVLALARCAEQPKEALERLAVQVQPAEQQYSLLDFIRCMEIKRNLSTVTVTVKTLKLDLEVANIDDHRRNHEYLASCSFELPSDEHALTDPSPVADLLLKSFYTATVRSPQRETPFEYSTWISRMRLGVPSGSKESAFNDESLDTAAARQLLVTSLKRGKFHFIMTHNTIFVLDQKKRLWGLNKKPRAVR